MPLTNAEKQKRHREKVKAERAELARMREGGWNWEDRLVRLNQARERYGLAPISLVALKREVRDAVTSVFEELETKREVPETKPTLPPPPANKSDDWGIF
jgi:hypothetical protein